MTSRGLKSLSDRAVGERIDRDNLARFARRHLFLRCFVQECLGGTSWHMFALGLSRNHLVVFDYSDQWPQEVVFERQKLHLLYGDQKQEWLNRVCDWWQKQPCVGEAKPCIGVRIENNKFSPMPLSDFHLMQFYQRAFMCWQVITDNPRISDHNRAVYQDIGGRLKAFICRQQAAWRNVVGV